MASEALLAFPASLVSAHHAAFKKTFLLLDWISGKPWSELEKRYGVYSGSIYRLAEDASWLIGCLAETAAAHALPEETVHRLFTLQEQTLLGIPEAGFEWIPFLRRSELTRSEALALLEAGYTVPTKIKDADRDVLKTIVREDSLEAIFRHLTPAAPEGLIESDNTLKIDGARSDHVFINGRLISLTKLQSRLIRSLSKRPGRCVEYETLLKEMWPEGYGDKKQLSRQKNLLRKKVESALGKMTTELIEAVPGIGLILRAKLL